MSSINTVEQMRTLSARGADKDPKLMKQAFQQFVGETLFRELVKTMREGTQQTNLMGEDSPASKMFQSQLDETLTQQLAATAGKPLSESLYEQFSLQLNDGAKAPKASQAKPDAQLEVKKPMNENNFDLSVMAMQRR